MKYIYFQAFKTLITAVTWFNASKKKPSYAEEGIRYVYSTSSKGNPEEDLGML